MAAMSLPLPPLTCVSCQVAFSQSENHRAHFKSDWHCYNLKRKLASLPPVTYENFQLRIAEVLVQKSEVKKSQYCDMCQKHFSSANAFQNHLKSRRHVISETRDKIECLEQLKKRNEKNKEKGLEVLPENLKVTTKEMKNLAEKKKLFENSEAESVDDDGSWEDVDDSGDDADDDASDEPYDITHCLFCSTVSRTVEQNLHHMILVHSFFIPDVQFIIDFEGLLTYLGEKVSVGHMCLWCSNKGRAFQSFKATQQHMIDKGHCKMLHEQQNAFEYADYYDYQSSYPDQAGDDPDAEVTPLNLADDAWELVLPSGATIGHRSLVRYFNQSLPLSKPRNSTLPRRISSHYQALGWTGTTGTAAVKKALDLKFMQKMKSKHYLKLGVRANKLQHHFRQQVLF